MTGADPMQPWGKLDRENPSRRLSLVGHSIDVAAVARALLELPTWRRRYEALAGRPFTAHDIDRLTVLAFWHDVGKAGSGFFAKGASEEERTAWHASTGRAAGQGGHTRVVAPLLREGDPRYRSHREALGIDALHQWGGHDVIDLWLAAVSHHGEPLTQSDLENILGSFPTWTAPVAGYRPAEGLELLGRTARSLWPSAFAGPPMATFNAALVHGFAGLVSFADWVGSKADDERFFPFDHAAQDSSRWKASLVRAREVLRLLSIDVEAKRADLCDRKPTFGSVFDNPPYEMQTAACALDLGRLVVLEAETGSGKTEAALWRFQALLACGEVDALSFLLPTRVAATGIYERIGGFVERLWPGPADHRPNVVLAVPGYLRANGAEGALVAPYRFLWGDADVPDPLFWAAENSKRYFAAAIAVATIDQFLLSTLRTRHAHMRGAVLLRSLVVVDEVHASDRYMRTLLVAGLTRHLAAGGHALLLSATLASDMRDQLMMAAGRRPRPRGLLRGGSAGPAPSAEPVLAPAVADYPRLTSTDAPPWIGRSTTSKAILRDTRPWMRDPEAVALLAAEAASLGARVLVIRNTVRQAVATQAALELRLGGDHPALFRCGSKAVLHHGRYALPDRQLLDAEVGRRYGKDAHADRRACVLVGTQTLEISVDCDADFLITDLAPMDVLLQRLGRLHRHARRATSRPAAFKEPARCVVLTPPTADLAPLLVPGAARGLGIGAKSAYPDLVGLQATLQDVQDLERHPLWRIPQHNRELVERCCNAEVLGRFAITLGPAWATHWNQAIGKESGQATLARMNAVVWHEPWHEASAGELDIDVRTRLGIDGVDLDFPAGRVLSALGQELTRLTLPAWMLGIEQDGARKPPRIDALTHDADAIRLRVGERSFIYDRWGLRVEAT